jgi:hypothetical protein
VLSRVTSTAPQTLADPVPSPFPIISADIPRLTESKRA